MPTKNARHRFPSINERDYIKCECLVRLVCKHFEKAVTTSSTDQCLISPRRNWAKSMFFFLSLCSFLFLSVFRKQLLSRDISETTNTLISGRHLTKSSRDTALQKKMRFKSIPSWSTTSTKKHCWFLNQCQWEWKFLEPSYCSPPLPPDCWIKPRNLCSNNRLKPRTNKNKKQAKVST